MHFDAPHIHPPPTPNTHITCRLMLVPVKTLQMSEDVMSICYSPDQRLLAVSLLDSTVKVFFADTLKVR